MIPAEQWFRALADSTRLHCLLLLQSQGQLCVCELVHGLDLSQPKISRHLAQLRDQGLVETERRGQWVYYRLSPSLPDWALEVLALARQAESLEPLHQRLASMPNRPTAACD
jgi:ArsR family transcriptional regulator, arsenate/arsenite/antimonite-responsive transcriptional repressor